MLMKALRVSLAAALMLFICRSSFAGEYEITYSGTINGNSIDPTMGSSFYSGESFEGQIFFNSDAPTVTSGDAVSTAGQSMSLLVGGIATTTAPMSIFRIPDASGSNENYYYFDSYPTTGQLAASGFDLQRAIVLYQVPFGVDPSFSTALITNQGEINALFPYWTLYMGFTSPAGGDSVYGTVTSMVITPVPEPSTYLIVIGGLVLMFIRKRVRNQSVVTARSPLAGI